MSSTPPLQPENQESSPELSSNNQVPEQEYPPSISVNNSAGQPLADSPSSSNKNSQSSQLSSGNTSKKIDWWRRIEVIAIVFTLIFVGLQLNEQKKATELQTKAINQQIESINTDQKLLIVLFIKDCTQCNKTSIK